ncbi:GMC oxidoreductase [Sandaracinus amylolyticus]|uniref:Glucose-methanol-choline (GMC) oxidoreductase n=1 Tax=Sandaracinus amylolyticus TaxID=927083 RepID=A0A0F6W5E2_9BACT|nr:GMC family oxidoreductase [Sandaracinus amylolyticus]AKF07867.1 Glucose-methanol-choline (GMC) oxidoreductase [Sandaracinus amylolyticus]
MSIRDARSLEEGTALSADVCIVGAGAAGITIALELLGRGRSVLLLESGAMDLEPSIQALYDGTMSGIRTFRLDDHRWRHFGGSTNRWAGWCMPLLAEDFTPRDHVPLSGWPIALEDLAPYYERAQELAQIGDRWDAERLAGAAGRALLPAPGGHLATRVFRYSPPTRFGRTYRPLLEDSAQTDVLMHANLVGIEVDGARVSRLACAALGGPRFSVEAGAYVLAMGGLENARMLLASDVANGSDWVGRCFMEHPHLYDSAAWLELGHADVGFYADTHGTEAGDEVRGALALSREVREAEGLLDFTITLREQDVGAETGEVIAPDVARLWRGSGDARLFRMTLRAEQSPYEESRVTLRDDVDALGVPRLDLRWQVRDDDLRAYRRAMEVLGRELGAAGLGRVWTPRDAEGRFADEIAPGGHHMGTTRMSADSAKGVVDADCRCHEVEDLYVAGSSVFTTGGSANPTLTIVALAARLADHLAGGAS